jgi:hypothetical protein
VARVCKNIFTIGTGLGGRDEYIDLMLTNGWIGINWWRTSTPDIMESQLHRSIFDAGHQFITSHYVTDMVTYSINIIDLWVIMAQVERNMRPFIE